LAFLLKDGLKVSVMPEKDPLGLTLLERLGVRVRSFLTGREYVNEVLREKLALIESDWVEELPELKVSETVVLLERFRFRESVTD
jgi:hypothetical protein